MRLSLGHLIAIAVSLLGSLISPAHAAVDMFLKIEGVKGESQDQAHKDEIDVLAWSWQLSKTSAAAPIIRPISVVKYTDSASPALISNLLMGTTAPTATLTVRTVGSIPFEYVVIDLKDVVVTSVSNGGSGTEDRLTEQVYLGFSQVCITYTPQLADGSAGASETTCWDVNTNSAP